MASWLHVIAAQGDFRGLHVKQSIKNLLGGFMFASHLDDILLGNAAVVIAFHRIQEAPASDSLSIGAGMFARLCRFFAERFQVVPLGDIPSSGDHVRRWVSR